MRKIYYGWYVCAAGMLLIFITMGVAQNGFSVFMPYIRKEYGFTNAQTSALVTVRCLVAFVAMMAADIFYRKFSLRQGTSITAFSVAIAFLIYSVAETYPMFCIGSALAGLGYGLGTMIPLSILMEHWFVRHRALALSICACGSGIATMILPPIATGLVESFSLNIAFAAESACSLAVAFLVVIIMRDNPSDKGLKPYGSDDIGEPSENPTEITEASRNGGQPRMNKPLWILLGVTSLLMGAIGNSGFAHFSMLYISSGFTAETVAFMISSVGIVLTIAKVIFGDVTDRIGGFKSSILFSTILFLGNVLCCFAYLGNPVISGLNVLLLGVGYPIGTIGQAIWAGDLASEEEFSRVVGRLQIAYSAGSLVFSSIPGILADKFGSYIPAYIMFSACGTLTIVFLAIAYRSKEPCGFNLATRKQK